MSSVQELPNELQKLVIDQNKIAPKQLIDKNVSLKRNPFYDDGIYIDSGANIKNLKRQSCMKCRLRRRSESCLEDYKHISSSTLLESVTTVKLIPRVQKQSLRKMYPTSKGKKIVREPVLRALQTCYHRPNVTCKKNDPDTLNTIQKSKNCGIVDFSEVVKNHKILDADIDQCRLFNELHISNSSSTNFSTIRTLTAETSLRSLSEITHANDLKLGRSCLHCSENSQSSQITTCSQEAGNSGVPNDDVTIDELACYFDTFVHIPKKMSTMAEMMYI